MSCQTKPNLSDVDFLPGDIRQLGAGLDENLGEVVVVVTCGHHVEAHQDVEGQREHWQIPTTVNGCQSTGHDWAGTNKCKYHFSKFII